MKKVLVTGAAGFLGVKIVQKLRLAGYDVVTTDKVPSVDYLGDLKDAIFLKSLPDVDVIVHSAAVQYVTSNKPLLDWKTWFYTNNVIATRNLIDRYKGQAVHFVHVGTSMQYHQNNLESYKEGAEQKSQGVYSDTKLIAQMEVNKSGFHVTTVIPCIIGGVGRAGLFKSLVKTIRYFSIAIIPGSGLNPISIVHVDDVAELIKMIVKTGVSGVYNASAIDALNIIDWVDIISNRLGKKKVRILRIPLIPLAFISKITGYRILAREQLVMLSMPHILDGKKMHNFLRTDIKSTATVINEITDGLVKD